MSRVLFILFSFALVAMVAGGIYWNEQTRNAAFERNDAAALPEDETGLRHAYEFLREGGYRVALQTPEEAVPPQRELAWWIFQSGPDWFADPEARAKEIRTFVERGGTVVFAPVEAVTVIHEPGMEETSDDELTGRVNRFFGALGLDLRLVAFEPPPEDEDVLADQEAPSGYPLLVTGHGKAFESLNEVETSWGNYFEGESLLRSEIRLNSDGFPLLVEFPMGRGKLVLIAESTYFENEFLDRPANRQLLAALAQTYGGGGIQLFTAR